MSDDLKAKAHVKQDYHVFAHMKIMVDTVQGATTIEYCSHHNSHSIKLAHIPIPPDIKHMME